MIELSKQEYAERVEFERQKMTETLDDGAPPRTPKDAAADREKPIATPRCQVCGVALEPFPSPIRFCSGRCERAATEKRPRNVQKRA